MRVCGFTILRDGVRLGYPFVESLRSALPLVDECVVLVGDCTDDTRTRLEAIGDPRVRLVDSVWDPALLAGGRVLAAETNKALDLCRGDWLLYLQGDEVLHEAELDRVRHAMRAHLRNPRVEGLTFRYHHFKGAFNLRDPLPYRRQVRIVRGGIGVRSVGDACGFALGDPDAGGRKLRTRPTGAWVYHYGWVRPPRVMNQKHHEFIHLYDGWRGVGYKQAERLVDGGYPYDVARCEPFRGTHPAVMAERVAAQDWVVPFAYTPKWRNAAWWDGFLRKNFSHVYRRAG